MNITILGGGQLAKMLIESARKYKHNFIVVSKEEGSPAGIINRRSIIGDWNNDEVASKIVSASDIVTLENEFIDPLTLEKIEQKKPLYPSSKVIRLIQDKLIQKNTLQGLNIPVAAYSEASSPEDIKAFAEKYSYPVVLKSRTMGYDGKGNLVISSEEECLSAFEKLSKRGKLMCEQFINFKEEIAVQAARSANNEIVVYPVVRTIQQNHICHRVEAAQDLYNELTSAVNSYVHSILESLSYVGVMGIEMFLMKDSTILVNELAPRVHNTGHYTIEGSECSQFENHIRAISGMPLGSTALTHNAGVMINILGSRTGKAELKGIEEFAHHSNAYLHIYGKKETKPGRKMGHITVTGDNLDEARNLAESLHSKISI